MANIERVVNRDDGAQIVNYINQIANDVEFPHPGPFGRISDYMWGKAVQDLQLGRIPVSNFPWVVGDKRRVMIDGNLFDLVILHKGGKTLTSGDECNFVIGIDDILTTKTNCVGAWNALAVRTWVNEDFVASLPDYIRNRVRPFKNQEFYLNGTTGAVKVVEANATIPSLKELRNLTSYYVGGALYSVLDTDGVQFDYYKVASNITQRLTRSNANNSSASYPIIYTDGTTAYHNTNASAAMNISPYFCI